MLTVIGLMPAAYALNLSMSAPQIHEIADRMPAAAEGGMRAAICGSLPVARRPRRFLGATSLTSA